MRVTRASRWMTLMLLGCALFAGCAGGSGSSGFDVSPSTENAAIQLVIDEQQCLDFEGLVICPAEPRVQQSPTPPATGQPSATPTPTATPGPPAGPAVDLGVAQDGIVRCAAAAPELPCAVTLPFAPQGFPDGSAFRVAVRTVDSDTLQPIESWRIGQDPVPSGEMGAPAFEAVADVPVADIVGGSAFVQFAVLVFPEPPAMLPASLESLGESGAEYAFVAPPVRLEVRALPGAPG